MIIADMEYVQEVAEPSQLITLEGGDGNTGALSSLFNLVSAIYPAASASILNLGNSGNNTAISINFAMPIMVVFNGGGSGETSSPRCGCRPFRRGSLMGF